MNAPSTCRLVFTHFGADGFAHFTSDCGLHARLEWSASAGGPWNFDRVVEAGQDIPIDPDEHSKPCYYRLVWVPEPESDPFPEPSPEEPQ